MKKRTAFSKPISIPIITLCLVFIVAITNGTNAYERPYYDPELQDGIPLMSAKSSMPSGWTSLKGGRSDFDDNPMSTRRRSSDSDLEDNLEDDDDDDRDDYNKAGSSNHDSYENPAFGESQRAAKDGDDIENFFDKHLGPPQDSLEDVGGANSNEVPISELSSRSSPNSRDYDDQYEAAASSPLSNIFHSIIKAHKRPLVITTEEAPSSDSNTSTNIKDNNQASSTTPIGLSIIKTGPSSSSSSYGHSPIAYFAPMIASPSSINGYEQQQDNNDQSQDDGVREIIITRRPSSSSSSSFINHLQDYSPSGRLTHQSSNDHWRGAMSPRSRNPYDGEQQSDYSRYPVAASYAYQREQQHQPQEEPETVSYGLSFGAANDDDSNPDEQTSSDEPPPPAMAAASYPIYNSRNSMRNSASMLRPYQNYQYHPMYNSNPATMYNRQQHYYQQQQMMQQHQQQSPYHGARYHKDPSESIAQPVSYISGGQYSPATQSEVNNNNNNNNNYNDDNNNISWNERQRLLATLDRQIKNNLGYIQQSTNNLNRQQLNQNEQVGSQQSTNNYPQRTGSRRFIISKMPSHRQQQHHHLMKPTTDNDVDTYSSFHSEVDPYKSFTSSSHIISEPTVDNTLQSGSYRSPIGQPDLRNKNQSLIDNMVVQQNTNVNNNFNNLNNHHPANNIISTSSGAGNGILEGRQQQQQHALVANNNNNNLLTGPIVNTDSQQISLNHQTMSSNDLMRNKNKQSDSPSLDQQVNSRVRREDLDDREVDDADDDGVWVDDDEDDDNRQQSSDLNETAQEPEEEDSQQDEVLNRATINPPGVIGGPHSYELAPDDLIVYPG